MDFLFQDKISPELFDSHCHLNDSSFDEDRAEVVEKSVEAGVSYIIDMAENVESSRLAIENSKKFKHTVFASVGIDPHVLIPREGGYYDENLLDKDYLEERFNEIRSLVQENPNEVVMLGETGMDDYWYQQLDTPDRKGLLQLQEKLFRMHLELGEESGLPLSVHSRAAEERCLEIVKTYPAARGIFHSFTGDYVTAKKILDAGWALGVNGIVTYKNAVVLREMYKNILGEISTDWSPGDFYSKGIYFETDAPFLTPLGSKSGRNEPANINKIYEYMATI